ncbi:MAG: phosphotransferase, partial [Dehalococcoidia bacterium]
LWRRTRALLEQPWPEAQPTLVHRDYHPGNILWTRGAPTGITDWVSAATGPSGVDAAHMRANLADLLELRVADDFRDSYEAIAGAPHHPYWDLLHAVDRGEIDAAQWHDAGRIDLTGRVIARRREQYLESVVRALC